MVECNTKCGIKLWVSQYENYDTNSKRLTDIYCQVYTDDGCENEVDNFVIHPEFFTNGDGKEYTDINDVPYLSIKKYIRQYVWDNGKEIIINQILKNK